MKIHTGRMLDRYLSPRPTLRVQEDNGHIRDVAVREKDIVEASAHWGGNYVSYIYHGGKAVYISEADRAEE